MIPALVPGTLLTAKVIILVMNENLRNHPSQWLQVGIKEEQNTMYGRDVGPR